MGAVMTEQARVFIAVEIPELRPLQRVVQELARMGRAVKAVSGAQWHLTLRFLGDVDRDLIPIVAETLESVAESHPPFTLRVVSHCVDQVGHGLTPGIPPRFHEMWFDWSS